jgi:putative Mn2+ efflux pump MntP
MRHDLKIDIQHELSWFLIAYLLTLLGILMLVHALQPERERSESSSRSPVHQERQQAK